MDVWYSKVPEVGRVINLSDGPANYIIAPSPGRKGAWRRAQTDGRSFKYTLRSMEELVLF